MNVPVVRVTTVEHAETKLTASTAHAHQVFPALRVNMVRMLTVSELPYEYPIKIRGSTAVQLFPSKNSLRMMYRLEHGKKIKIRKQ